MKEDYFNCAIIDYYLMLPDFRFALSNPSKDFLDSAYLYDIEVILTTPDNCAIFKKPGVGRIYMENQDSMVRNMGLTYYGNHPALAGLNVVDEPHREDFQYILPYAQDIKIFNPDLLSFVNLIPAYGGAAFEAFYSELGHYEAYEQYVQDCIDIINPNILSFDHYPFFAHQNDLFYHLDLISKKSTENTIPFIYVLTSTEQPSYSEVKSKYKTSYGIYSALFYGAKGIAHWNSIRPLNSFSVEHRELVRNINQKIMDHEDLLLSLSYKNAYHKSLKSTIGIGEESIPNYSHWQNFPSDPYANEMFNISNPLVVLPGSTMDSLAVSFLIDDLGNRYFWVFNKSLSASEDIRLNLKDGCGVLDILSGNTCLFYQNAQIHLEPTEAKLFKFVPSQIETNAITENVTWKNDRVVYEKISIEPFATLTIKGTISFAANSSITIHPGGKLVIDGGRLTGGCGGGLWQGIEIHGNPDNLSQDISLQGYLELKNGAVVENAHTGVVVGSSVSSERKGGGILKATDARFVNCVTSVAFKPYTRLLGSRDFPNRSGFTNCEFVWNGGMVDHGPAFQAHTHVKMSNVGQISFSGCAFRNEKFPLKVTKGISSENSGLKVSAIMKHVPSAWEPSVETPGVFENFTYGIYYGKNNPAINTGLPFDILSQLLADLSAIPISGRSLSVTHSRFVGNVQGIFNTNANNATITRNHFDIGSRVSPFIPTGLEIPLDETQFKGMSPGELDKLPAVPIYKTVFGLGINMNSSSGYTIQGNSFAQGNPDIPLCAGILVKNSGGSPNKIDNNRFDFLHVGILSNGHNKTDYGNDGLQLLCNTFSSGCEYAIAVQTANGLAQMQGSPSQPAGNVFAQAGRPEQGDFYTALPIPAYYYYHSSAGEEYPSRVTEPYILRLPASQPSHCGIPPGISWEKVSLQAFKARERYAGLLYNHDNLIDGGSTSRLLMELELGWDKGVWEIRDALLGMSPYLSPDVIRDVAEKGLLPHAMLLEVCLSNPDATRQGDLLHFLQYKLPNPMPEYMCGLISASWEVETFRTHLEASLADAALDFEHASRQLIRLYHADTSRTDVDYTDSIIYLLELLPGVEAAYDLADLYSSSCQFDLAFQKLEGLRGRKLSKREEEELDKMKTWYEFVRDHVEKGPGEQALSSDELHVLSGLAKTESRAGDRAKSLLYHYSGSTYNYHVEPEFPGFIKPKSSTIARNPQEMLNESCNTVSVFPNPSETHATFMYDLQPDAKHSELQIIDNKGALVLTAMLNGNSGHYLWDTRTVASGLYTYAILSGDKKLNSGKIVVKK
jgi:hypothetical protein